MTTFGMKLTAGGNASVNAIMVIKNLDKSGLAVNRPIDLVKTASKAQKSKK